MGEVFRDLLFSVQRAVRGNGFAHDCEDKGSYRISGLPVRRTIREEVAKHGDLGISNMQDERVYVSYKERSFRVE